MSQHIHVKAPIQGGGDGGSPGGSGKTAATFVVSQVAGQGDFTTLAAALAAIVAKGGGFILVREGTYSNPLTNTVPAGLPIIIRGCGDATIFDLAGNAIPLITVPTGYTENTPVVLEDFKVIGTEVAEQTVLEYADANSLAEVFMARVNTVGVEKTIKVTAAAAASSSPGQDDARFHMEYCRIRPNSTDTSVMLSNTSFGYPRCWMKEVEFIGDSLFAIPMGRTAPLFGKLASDDWFGDCYLDGCEMSVGAGEHDFATLESINSIVWNNDDVNTSIDFFLNGNFEGFASGTLRESSFRGIHFSSFENTNYLSNLLQDCPLELYGAGTVVGDNQIIQVRAPWPTTFVVQVNNEDMVIRQNRFRCTSPPAQIVDLEAPCVVDGNDFSECHPGANGSVFVNNGDTQIVNNRFTFAPTTGPNLVEGNGPNMYDNNIRMFTNKTGGGPIIDPVLPVGNGSTVQGMVDFNAAGAVGGTATNSLIVWYRNPYGLAKVQGYVHNTGVNNITVREQYITQNEGTATRSTVVTPGTKYVIDPFNLGGLGIDNQVVDYRVDVSGTAIAWHTYFGAPDCVAAT